MVSHVSREVIVGIFRNFDLRGTVVDQWRILVRLAANKSVEVLKTGMSGPTIIWSSLRYFPGRCFVVLTVCCRAETVLSQDFSHRRYRLWSYPIIAGKRSRGFHDRSSIVAVMVVTG